MFTVCSGAMNVRGGMLVLLILIFNYVPHAATGISPEVSPSPSPQPIVTITDERCSTSSKTTCHDLKTLTACLNTSSSKAYKDLFLVVQNDGEEPLKANIVIVDIDYTLSEILLSKHQAKKIKILANIDGSPAMILNAGNGKCIIPVGSMGLHNASYKQYVAYLSPIYGGYFLFFVILIAGGALACYKFGKNEHQVDRIRYQELEMEQPTALSANDEEMAAGWNGDWGDNWDEEREEKSPNANGTENVSSNGHTSKASDPDQWGNEWED